MSRPEVKAPSPRPKERGRYAERWERNFPQPPTAEELVAGLTELERSLIAEALQTGKADVARLPVWACMLHGRLTPRGREVAEYLRTLKA